VNQADRQVRVLALAGLHPEAGVGQCCSWSLAGLAVTNPAQEYGQVHPQASPKTLLRSEALSMIEAGRQRSVPEDELTVRVELEALCDLFVYIFWPICASRLRNVPKERLVTEGLFNLHMPSQSAAGSQNLSTCTAMY